LSRGKAAVGGKIQNSMPFDFRGILLGIAIKVVEGPAFVK
jgi:hypothetical protein